MTIGFIVEEGSDPLRHSGIRFRRLVTAREQSPDGFVQRRFIWVDEGPEACSYEALPGGDAEGTMKIDPFKHGRTKLHSNRHHRGGHFPPGGLTGGIGSFILFWTMAFDIVHIYG
jgi:hypothetical protein